MPANSMNTIHTLTLRTKDGREQRTLAWFPTETVRQDFYNKARRKGLEIIENELNK